MAGDLPHVVPELDHRDAQVVEVAGGFAKQHNNFRSAYWKWRAKQHIERNH